MCDAKEIGSTEREGVVTRGEDSSLVWLAEEREKDLGVSLPHKQAWGPEGETTTGGTKGRRCRRENAPQKSAEVSVGGENNVCGGRGCRRNTRAVRAGAAVCVKTAGGRETARGGARKKSARGAERRRDKEHRCRRGDCRRERGAQTSGCAVGKKSAVRRKKSPRRQNTTEGGCASKRGGREGGVEERRWRVRGKRTEDVGVRNRDGRGATSKRGGVEGVRKPDGARASLLKSRCSETAPRGGGTKDLWRVGRTKGLEKNGRR